MPPIKSPEKGDHAVGTKWAVSYKRVSTKDQNLYRQDKALKDWLAAHPEYKEDVKAAVQKSESGRLTGRLDWFLKKGYPRGTVLVVENMDRFSRMQLDEGIDLLRTMFSSGYGLAICGRKWGGEILTTFNKRGREIFDELQRARDESDRKKERADEAVERRRDNIRDGNLSGGFKKRGERKRCDYPFWVDFHPEARDGRGEFRLNGKEVLIQRMFDLALQMGADNIAQELKKEGFKTPSNNRTFISPQIVRYYLSYRAVLGEYQFSEGITGKAVGDPIEGVFPPAIEKDLWLKVRAKIDARTTHKTSVSSKCFYNLFQGRTFCINCGSLAGFRSSQASLADGKKQTYGFLRCRAGLKDKTSCHTYGQQKGVRYDEVNILEQLQQFRWRELFSVDRHNEEIDQLTQKLLAAEHRSAEIKQQLNNLESQLDSGDVSGALLKRLNDKYNQKSDELDRAKEEEEKIQTEISYLKSQKTGEQAVEEVMFRVRQFTQQGGRDDVEQRSEFNRWVHDQGLMLVMDPANDRVLLGTGRVGDDDRIERFYEGSEDVGQDRLERGEAAKAERDEMAKDIEEVVKEHGLYKGWRMFFGFKSPWELMDGLPEDQLVGITMFGHLHLMRVPPKDKFPDPMSKEVWGPPR